MKAIKQETKFLKKTFSTTGTSPLSLRNACMIEKANAERRINITALVLLLKIISFIEI